MTKRIDVRAWLRLVWEQTHNTRVICLKELRAYFNAPTAYVVIVVFLLISGWLFGSTIFLNDQVSIRQFLDNTPLLFIFLIPAIAMRLLAEETKEGTMEVLATLPLRDTEIVIGKYLAACALLGVLLVATLIYPVSLAVLAHGGMDWGQIAGAYLGLACMGASFLAMGLFASAITRNQIIGFIIGFVICFIFFLLGKVVQILPSGMGAIAAALGVDSHVGNLSRGVIDTRDLLYFFSLIGYFLYSTVLVVTARR